MGLDCRARKGHITDTDYRDLNLIAVDTETTGLEWHNGHYPFLATTSTASDDSVYDLTGGPGPEEFVEEMVYADGWIFHNAAFDIHMIAQAGLMDLEELLARPIHDTATLARILISVEEANWQYGLKPLSKLLVDSSYGDAQDELKDAMVALGIAKKNQKILPDGAFYDTWQQMPALVEKYAMQDTRATYDLFFTLLARASEADLKVYEMEMDVLKELIRMEHRGVALDTDRVKQLFDEYTEYMNAALAKLMVFVTIEDFNPDSNDQVAQTLIQAGVPLTDLTDSGQIRVDKWALGRHEGHPCIDALLEYRMYAKFLSTYLGSMLGKEVLHPSIWGIGARTGRMSCSNPNMQNIPVRSGPEVRSVMVPREGYAFIVADYSSIELRVLAYYMADPAFWDIVLDPDHDAFAWLGEQIYGTHDQSLWPVSRSALKNGTYAILYGAGGPKLASTIGGGMTAEEGRELARSIRTALGRHFTVLNNSVKKAVKTYGFVRTIMKRTQHVPRDRDYTGLNYLIQGSAADVMKLGLLNAAKACRDYGAYLLLPVHDELVIECPLEHVNECRDAVETAMTTAIDPLELTNPMPLAVSSAICNNSYAEAK